MNFRQLSLTAAGVLGLVSPLGAQPLDTSFEMVVQSVDTVGTFSVSPDGQFLLNNARTVLQLWNKEGILLRDFDVGASNVTVKFATFLPDSQHVLALLDGSEIGVFQFDLLGRRTQLGTIEKRIYAALLAGYYDDVLRVWDVQTGGIISTFKGHAADVLGMAWSPDGRTVVSCARENESSFVRWDAKTGVEHKRFKSVPDLALPFGALAWLKDSKRILAGSYDGTVKVFDAASGRVLQSAKAGKDWVVRLVLAPDETTFATGSARAPWRSGTSRPSPRSGRSRPPRATSRACSSRRTAGSSSRPAATAASRSGASRPASSSTPAPPERRARRRRPSPRMACSWSPEGPTAGSPSSTPPTGRSCADPSPWRWAQESSAFLTMTASSAVEKGFWMKRPSAASTPWLAMMSPV